MRCKASAIVALMMAASLSLAQQSAPANDAALDVASAMIGRALFLRCFCVGDHLSFDAQGHVIGSEKKADWTVSGVNVLKVSRKGADEIEMDGVRAAVRFAPDRDEFDRKPQNELPVRLMVKTSGDAAQFQQALGTIFSTGIDRALQRSTPDYWQHYFDPTLKWSDDSLTGQSVMSITASTAGATTVVVTHRVDAGYTAMAAHDHVVGDVTLRFVVDADGVAQRIAIGGPLGYGLDEKAVEALEKYRFRPATYQGKPMASNVTIDETFRYVPMPQ